MKQGSTGELTKILEPLYLFTGQVMYAISSFIPFLWFFPPLISFNVDFDLILRKTDQIKHWIRRKGYKLPEICHLREEIICRILFL